MRNKKAQIRTQEMAFVLLALALLAIIAFIFFIKIQSSNIVGAGEIAKQKNAISLLDKIASLQEISCSEGEICLDEDKINIAKNYDLSNLFQGLKKIEIKRIYPAGNDLIIYESGKGNQSYSTFVNLCKQEKTGSSFAYKCGMDLLEVWY